MVTSRHLTPEPDLGGTLIGLPGAEDVLGFDCAPRRSASAPRTSFGAVRVIAGGEALLSPSVTRSVIAQFVAPGASPGVAEPPDAVDGS